jgi:hypothetical protein
LSSQREPSAVPHPPLRIPYLHLPLRHLYLHLLLQLLNRNNLKLLPLLKKFLSLKVQLGRLSELNLRMEF